MDNLYRCYRIMHYTYSNVLEGNIKNNSNYFSETAAVPPGDFQTELQETDLLCF